MADNEINQELDSSSVGLDTDKFETPRQSDNESEVDVNKLVMGEAYDQLDEEARENIGRVQGDLNVELLEKDDDDQSDSAGSSEREERKGRHDSSEEEVHTNIDEMVMYTIQGSAGEKSVRVLKFTGLFLPDTEKRRKQMERFNRKKMGIDFEFENESVRKRKRELKEGQRRIQKQHIRKAQYLPVNPFMEDFYFLQSYSKSGVAPQPGKKLQVPQGYKQLFTQNKFENSLLEKIVASKSTKKIPQVKSVQFLSGQPQRGEVQDLVRQNGRANAETEQKKDFTLEACQINELKSQIVEASTTSSNILNSTEATELCKRLRSAKTILKRSLEQKIPKTRISKIERQSFALLSNLRSIYEPSASNQSVPLKKGVLPSEVDIYELMIEQKFKQSLMPTKRVKYWGELKDCISEHQLAKDAHMIKRQEWVEFVKSKQTFKQPVFSLLDPAWGANKGEQSNSVQKDTTKTLIKSSGMAQAAHGQRVLNPENNQGSMANQINAQGRARRPAQIVVEKTDFDLVASFEEYEKLKKQEEMYYQQRKKVTVTAESIMRHVRWKMGRISDKDFYKEECEEIKREQKIQIEKAKSMQQQMPQRKSVMGTSSTEATEAEPRDLESVKNQRNIPVDFEENLDKHFDKKRFEIQASILRRKTEKERASQQKQSTTQTPAYEPIVPEIHKESEDDHQASEPQHNSDNESSSSDSDSDSDESVKQQNAGGHTMLPSIADELNHAQCIKDLSFFKLNWEDRDLETFHRPNVQSFFMERQNGQMQATAVSAKKEDKETRLNPHQYFKNRFKLSLNKGKFCVFEHIDQNPLFVNNFGMASRLKRYFYGDKQPTKKEFLNQKNENVRNRHIGPYGKLLMKAPLDRLDLLGQVDKTKYNGLTMLENNMYNAPVFYHRMPSTSNDFFCSIIKQPNNERRIVIRSLNSLYTVGQIEPKREVYNPQSRHFTHFIKQQSKAYTTRLLQENKIMSFHDIRQFFPDIGSPILKKGLKEIEVEQDRNGYCKLNANFEMERHKDRMTPEMICQYESAKHGQYRLARIGISEILSADKISYSTHKFCFEETDLILQRVAKLIESEVLQTPWNLSSNYIKIKQEGSMMMLEGQGDPSYGHGGYSYLKMPLKISADSIQGAKANRMNLNPAIQNPKAVTGTEADLRKLKKQTLFQILLEAGVPENELTTKTRWEMVAMLRCYASQNQPDSQFNQNGMKSFYARGVRNTSKKQQEMYNKRANSTFRKQMDMLSDPNPKELHDLSEDQPNFVVLPDLEAMGLLKVGKGFGTSLTKSKKDKENQAMMVQTKRDPGENAKDFTRDIFVLVNDESRKQIVEVHSMPEVKRIEDIKDYLKLFLVIHPNALSPQNQNPSGINIGGVSSNAEFLYAMNGNGSKEWEKKLLDKLNKREISKKCEILCHKIRSLTQDDGQLYKEDSIDGEKQYERVIFCADEKAIKKFRRCMNKNQLRQPRRTNRRNFTRSQTRPLTDENLRLQAAKNTMPSQGLSTVRSNTRSINSASVQRGGTTLAIRNSGEKPKTIRNERGDAQIYSHSHRWEDNKGSTVQVQSYRSMLNSGSKPKSKKRLGKTLIATPQPSFRFAFTNNGVIIKPGDPQPALPMVRSQEEDEYFSAIQNNQDPNKSTNYKPISLQTLPGSAVPMSQPPVSGSFDQRRISFRLDHMVSSQPQLGDDGDQVMDGQQGDEDQSGESQDSKQLVNNEGISEVRSEYEPEQASEESSDYDFEQLRNSQMTSQKSQSRKKLHKGSSMISTKYQNLNLVMQKQNSTLGRKNSRGIRKNPSSTQKFKPHGFSKDDYEYQNLTNNKSRRRQQQDGKQSLNNIFLEVVDDLWEQEESYLFQNQPTRQDAPNYRDLIKQPIALKDMKNKCKRHEYSSRANFEADLELMVSNSEQFNGVTHYISQLARDIQTRALHIMNNKKGDIGAMECVIQMDGAGQII